ncbi:MAG: ABC transporter substrate-binding protein [Myxococcales bacterium]|nr:ABC transporter substrate-binding protein [Myxococcales bacterium]
MRSPPWILATLLFALSSSCTNPGPGPRGEPIKIGVIVSLTGALGPVGPHLANSARLAAREVNAAGGLLGGRRVELVVVDDRTDPAFAARVAQELVEDEGVVAIVGSLASSASLQVQTVTAAAEIPQVSCCSTSPDLTTAQPAEDRFLFRTVPSDLLQSVVVSRYAHNIACERLAVLHLDDSYGNPFGMAIERNFRDSGGTVVARVPFTGERSSYTTEVRMIADAAPDCVALVAFPVDGGRILRDWSGLAARPNVTWIGTDGIKDPGFPTAAGSRGAVDGVVGTSPIVEPMTPEFNAYSAAYEATFSEPVGIFGGSQYDAMALVLLAIEQAGNTGGVAIRDALFEVSQRTTPGDRVFGPGQLSLALQRIRDGLGVDYEGAAGPVDFDELGDVVSDYEIWRYDADAERFVRVDTIPASSVQ